MTLEEMKKIKQEYGYSYEQISDLSDVPLGTVRKVLGGTTASPRHATLEALSAAFARIVASSPAPAADAVREPGAAYAAAVPRQKKQGEFTLDDYLALPDDQRVELIDGVFYNMSSPMMIHQLIAGQLHLQLSTQITAKGDRCIPFIAPADVQIRCDDRTIVQPDVMVVCDRDKIHGQRIYGAPDLIIEIASKSTWSKDLFIKGRLYQEAGVREYWFVQPKNRSVIVFLFENHDIADCKTYSFRDTIPVSVSGGECMIDFAKIDDYVSFLYGKDV